MRRLYAYVANEYALKLPNTFSSPTDVNVNLTLKMWISTFNCRFCTWLEEIAMEMNRVLLKNAKFKWFKIQNFQKIAKIKCREICTPQNHEINVSQKFYVTR